MSIPSRREKISHFNRIKTARKYRLNYWRGVAENKRPTLEEITRAIEFLNELDSDIIEHKELTMEEKDFILRMEV